MFSIYAHGALRGKGSNMLSGCGIVLVNEGQQRRELSYRLSAATVNAASLSAARLALWAVSKPRSADQVTLFTESKYVFDMLDRVDDDWRCTPKSNHEDVAALREVFLKYINVNVTVGKFTMDDGMRAVSLSRTVMDGKNHDSGTMMLTNSQGKLE